MVQDGTTSYHNHHSTANPIIDYTSTSRPSFAWTRVAAGMNQPNPNPNANANPPTAAAIARMKEIFNDPSRSEDAIKCATKDEVQELMSDYSLTSKQITSEFRKMYKAEWIRKRRII